MPDFKHALLFIAGSIAACTSSPEGPQNEVPPPVAVSLKSANGTGYAINVAVGGSQFFDALVDTGSTTFGVAGVGCSDCTGLSPEYMPGPNATELGSAEAMYAIGEWTGNIYADSVALGGDAFAPFTMKFADIDEQMDMFPADNATQGILGLGPADLATPGTDSYETDRIAAGGTGEFAIQMCDGEGTMWFDGVDKTHEVSDEQYTALAPIGSAAPYYEIAVQSASIGDTTIDLGGVAVADTGTTAITMPTTAAHAFATALSNDRGFQSMFIGQTFQLITNDEALCLTSPYSRSQIDAALPKLEVTLDDLDGTPFTLSLPATESYLLRFGTSYCAAIVDDFSDTPITIFGDAFLRPFISVFDPANSRIGFAPGQGCANPDEAHQPPPTQWLPYVHGRPIASKR